tara:strand:+ start:3542 stop:4657 length:1116 start_codon:yes stop_codon:yes gene_type:complete
VNSKKEIWINGKFLSLPVTGVQRFSWGICQALYEKGFQLNILMNKDLQHQPDFGKLIRVGKHSGIFWEQVELPRFLKNHGNPMLFNPGNVAPVIYTNNFVVVHDAATLEPHSEWFSTGFRMWYQWLIPQLAKRAKIATVSRFSAERLAHFLNLDIDQIPVLYNGIYFHKVDDSNKTENNALPEKPYILAVGSHNPRKGIDLLINAFLSVPQLHKNYDLLIIGSHSRHFKDFELKDHPSILWKQNVSDTALIHYYKNTDLVVVPSRYEGFGIPVLEALHFNKPVLCNAIPVFKELFGSSVDYTDFEQTSISAQKLIEKLGNNPKQIKNNKLKKPLQGNLSAFQLNKCSFKSSASTIESYIQKEYIREETCNE